MELWGLLLNLLKELTEELTSFRSIWILIQQKKLNPIPELELKFLNSFGICPMSDVVSCLNHCYNTVLVAISTCLSIITYLLPLLWCQNTTFLLCPIHILAIRVTIAGDSICHSHSWSFIVIRGQSCPHYDKNNCSEDFKHIEIFTTIIFVVMRA